MNSRTLLRSCIVLLLAASVASCRDGAAPYEASPPPRIEGDTYRLTWGVGLDRNPQWSAAGDSIYFHTTYWRELGGASEGLLLRIPREGGVASPLAPDAQPNTLSTLLNPVLSRDGSKLAYVQLMSVVPAAACREAFEQPPGVIWACDPREPRLDAGVVRVRDVTASGLAALDPGVAVTYAGVDRGRIFASGGPYLQQAFPFQQAWAFRDNASSIRVSWSQDGNRVVFSDGLRLLLWQIGGGEATPIPNTADGVAPAWSPDGRWIAFTINERVDSLQYQCDCEEGTRRARHLRWAYTVRQQLAVIRPDGTELRVLTEGDEPAWAPGSDRIYFTHPTGIRWIALQGGPTTLLPGTVDAETPSVSPDGRWLAFARRKGFFEDHDLWVTRLQN